MKYSIGQSVFVGNSDKIKKIEFSEIINNINVYYFSDNTSCAEFQISKSLSYQDEFFMSINKNKKSFNKLIDTKTHGEMISKYYDKNTTVLREVDWQLLLSILLPISLLSFLAYLLFLS